MDKNNETNIYRCVDEHLTALNPDGGWRPNADRSLVRLQERLRVEKGHGRRWKWVVAAVGCCLFLFALPLPRAVGERCLNYCTEQLWPNHSDAHKDGPRSMMILPMKDLQGGKVTLDQYKGQVVLVNFWATWCSPCLVEMPWLIDFQQKYGQRGFSVLGISLDEDGKESVMPFIQNRRFEVNGQSQAVNYPILLGDSKTGEEFGGIIGLPTSMLFSRDGKRVKVITGLMSRDEVERTIQGLL